MVPVNAKTAVNSTIRHLASGCSDVRCKYTSSWFWTCYMLTHPTDHGSSLVIISHFVNKNNLCLFSRN
eukprot:m.216771 g.216771  ORF g.216771 m.216771 type:complete len:68 (+) comp17202_c0_seq21:150-353(+)